MAYKDSGEIATNSNYTLGDYSFRIERSSVPGSTNDKIEAICTDKDGKNARKSIQIKSTAQVSGWYVEANETEASVYVLVKNMPPVEGDINSTVISAETVIGSGPRGNVTLQPVESASYTVDGNIMIGAKAGPRSPTFYWVQYGMGGVGPSPSDYTYDEKTVCYATLAADFYGPGQMSAGVIPTSYVTPPDANVALVAWMMIYGDEFDDSENGILVGRFAIDIKDAGGVGPGSDWTDPEDYDEDWEEGDPTHTLYVTVTGALSGRHNDPIEDPSYSYIPADKDTVKQYGCGGDGGHGGGGGAGASTVVVHKFATNQANSKEVTAIARRHGYGSGGGKGGKGGDGCILVYY